MKIKDTLYIRILVWAYRKQEAGFTWGDLEKEFSLNKAQLDWVQKIFRSNLQASENLIDHLSYNDDTNTHLYVITAKGTSAAVQYLGLKEAEESGKRAERIARVAIIVGVIVGTLQIIISLLQLFC